MHLQYAMVWYLIYSIIQLWVQYHFRTLLAHLKRNSASTSCHFPVPSSPSLPVPGNYQCILSLKKIADSGRSIWCHQMSRDFQWLASFIFRVHHCCMEEMSIILLSHLNCSWFWRLWSLGAEHLDWTIFFLFFGVYLHVEWLSLTLWETTKLFSEQSQHFVLFFYGDVWGFQLCSRCICCCLCFYFIIKWISLCFSFACL